MSECERCGEESELLQPVKTNDGTTKLVCADCEDDIVEGNEDA